MFASIITVLIKYKIIIGALVVYESVVFGKIHKAKRSRVDTLIWNPDLEQYEGLCLYECDFVNYNIHTENVLWPKLLIKSDRNIYDLTIYNNVEWSDKRLKKWKIIKDDREDIKKIITPKECVIIKVYLAELIADQMIEFKNEEHMLFRMPLEQNLKDGDISIPVQYKMTLPAWIYFLTSGLIDYKK